MRTLVIDTATAACSVALIEGTRVVDRGHAVVGRGHAERLVPMIAALDDGGRADAVLVDCGPGSFTGIRVGIAAARGLGLGWNVPVLGYSSTTLLAATALARRSPSPPAIVSVVEGGHGEVFVQVFAATPLSPASPLVSLGPTAALDQLAGRPAVGSGVRWLLALDPALDATELLPDAADAVLLPAACAQLAPRPIYGRAPDAKPMA